MGVGSFLLEGRWSFRPPHRFIIKLFNETCFDK